MEHRIDKVWRRRRSKYRIGKRLSGTAERPRLVIFRSLNHIYAQAVDDEGGKTLAAASSRDKGLAGTAAGSGGNNAAAKAVGGEIARRLQEKGYKSVVFDRGGYRYHGRIRVLAEAARESGLRF
jgi:large subunit ribosomal protein L18